MSFTEIEPTLDLFPTDYAAARARFRASTTERLTGARDIQRSVPVPSLAHPDLTVDLAWFARGNSNLLIVQSGTHGVEGYAGSAAQERLLREHLARLLARGTDVLLIHAFDPFGYAFDRRVDEQNVNLNRNMLPPGEAFSSTNAGYRRLRSAFEPPAAVTQASLAYLRADARLIRALVGAGFDRRPISQAMNQGQYEFKEGLNYGGAEPSPQNKFLRQFLPEVLGNYRRVVFVDVHTGLGEADKLHWLTARKSQPEFTARLRPALLSLRPLGILLTDASADEGFYQVTGAVDQLVIELAPPRTEVVAVTAEFGTVGAGLVPQIRTAHRLIVENQAWFRGGRESALRSVRSDFRELFTPPCPTWRTGVIKQVDAAFTSLADALGQLN